MITILVGSADSGKELLLAYLITLEAKDKRRVYSNMNLTIPHENFDFPAFLEAINTDNENPLLNNCIIGLKDAWRLVNSRRSQSKDNKLFSWFTYQMRKRDVTIILETDRFTRIDWRIRKSCDILATCRGLLFGDLLYRLDDIKTGNKANNSVNISKIKGLLDTNEWAKRY